MNNAIHNVDVIAYFSKEGIPRPYKIRMEQLDESYIAFKVSKILDKKEEKIAGNRTIVYTCLSIINGIAKTYQLKFNLKSMHWYVVE